MRTLANIFTCILLLSALLVQPHSVEAQFKKKKKINKEAEKTKVITPGDIQASEQFFLEGQKYFMLEDFSKAFVYFQRCVSLNPNATAAYHKMADILMSQNELDQALGFAQKALDLDPDNKFYYLQVADIYSKQSNYKEAAKIYESLLKKMPDLRDYYFELAALYFYQGAYDDAIKTYNKVEKIIGLNEEITFQKQKVYLKQNKIKEALAEGEALIKANPGEPAYLLMQAQILVSNNKINEAIPYLEKLVNEDPKNGQGRLMLAEVYKQSGKQEKAEENIRLAFEDADLEINKKIQFMLNYLQNLPLESVKNIGEKLARVLIDVHPKEANAYAMYGDILFNSESKKEAREKYLQSLELDNSNFNIWQNVISIDLEENEMENAVQHSEKALEYFPNQAILYYFNGVANLTLKKYDEAAYALEHGKKLSSSNLELVSAFNSSLGDTYNGLKKYDKSDAAYEAALDFDPDNSHVLNNYSYFLSLRKEKLDKARRMASKLVKKYPDNPTFLDTYAWVLYVLGEYEEAKKHLQAALASGEESGVIIEHYGDVLFKLGQIDDALIQWKKAKGKDETSDLLDKKIADKTLYE